MPTSEFYCHRCKHRFQRLFFRGEEPEVARCPDCGRLVAAKSPRAERLFDGIADSSPLAKDTN